MTAGGEPGTLQQFPEMAEFRKRRGPEENDQSRGESEHGAGVVELTPDEQITAGYQRLRDSLATQLLERVKKASPRFFATALLGAPRSPAGRSAAP